MRQTLDDAEARVTGSIAFAQDVRVAGELHAAILRSREPSALLRAIDTSRAARVRGVAGVYTGADLERRLGRTIAFGPIYRDQPAMAVDRVRFAGEPVAAVVADDPDAAHEALETIEVAYDPLPAVLDLDAALAGDAPLVHSEPRPAGSYGFAEGPAGSNVCNRFRLRRGDVDAGFAAADHVFEDVFETPPVQHVALETHGATAIVRDGQVTVWSGTQTPHGTKTQLAELFGIPATAVRIHVPAIGGAFGSRGHAKLEPLAALLAYATGRPVRLQLDRAEEFVTITKHGARIRLRTGVRDDGRIVARAAECWFNTGAYADIGPRVVWYGGMGAAGPYAIDNIAVDSTAVYTNLPPAGAFRGFGFPQACWAHERQMDLIADALDLDPLEIRLRNVIADGGPFSTGEPFLDGHLDELLREAAAAVGWDPAERRSGEGRRVRARGIACVAKGTIVPSISTAILKLSDDGSLDVLSSSVDLGQGVRTTLAILAGEVLGLRPDRVNVGSVDTASTPYDSMTSASRTTMAMGAAVADAAGQIRREVARLAAEALEAAEEDLVFADGRVSVRGSPDRNVDLGQVVRRARLGNIIGTGRFERSGGLDPETGQGVGSAHWTSGVGAAEVEVDLDTGAIELVRYHAGTYAGRVVNRQMAELQVEGCVAFGVGQALMEELLFDDGQVANATLADYLLPAIRDVPSPTITLLEGAPGAEIHGLGEAALPPVMPAIANAVARATGVQVRRTPLSPEVVLRGLREGSVGAEGLAGPVSPEPEHEAGGGREVLAVRHEAGA
jgi:CO/xanthine dehydrogenase Mo-binding subunit